MAESNDLNIDDITPEQVFEIAKENGMDLTDEELEQVSGGGNWEYGKRRCPKCGSNKVMSMPGRNACTACHTIF